MTNRSLTEFITKLGEHGMELPAQESMDELRSFRSLAL